MPRVIAADMSMTDVKMEIIFTRASLGADPHAKDLVGMTDGLLEACGPLDAQMLANLIERTIRDAERSVANRNLDTTCIAFGDQLLPAVGKNRQSQRWTRYFDEAPNRFVKQDLRDQVKKVNGWLATQDPVLEPFREGLALWAGEAQKALDKDEVLKQATAELVLQREAFAKRLTQARDAIHRALAQRAEERDLGRDWADGFFRQG